MTMALTSTQLAGLPVATDPESSLLDTRYGILRRSYVVHGSSLEDPPRTPPRLVTHISVTVDSDLPIPNPGHSRRVPTDGGYYVYNQVGESAATESYQTGYAVTFVGNTDPTTKPHPP
jgi:hypothetical protein